MECLMQYLDDFEDFVYATALAAGRIFLAVKAVVVMIASVSLQIGVLLLALTQPTLGMAVVTILSVVLLYRAVVNRPGHPRPAALITGPSPNGT
jgi:hypothetical protein